LNSKSIKLQKIVMFTKIAPQFRKVLYKWTRTPGSKIAPRLEKSISSLVKPHYIVHVALQASKSEKGKEVFRPTFTLVSVTLSN
jgi:hypothetical protein